MNKCEFVQKFNQMDSENIVKAIEDDGCALIPNLIKNNKVAEIKDEIDRLAHIEHDVKASENSFDHFKCVFNRDPYWLQFIDLDGIIDAVEKLMGEDCHMIGMSAWRTPPGVGNKYLHIDQIVMPVDENLLQEGLVVLPVYYSTLHIYLSDITKELCPTYIIPGSHKSGRDPRLEESYTGDADDIVTWNGIEPKPVLVNAGDGMLFRSEVWHGGSKNETTDQTRYLLQVHYGRRGIAQRFPPYLKFKFNENVLDKASDRQLRYLGKHPIGAYG